jgi:DDB1- and CUL4-associated factor 7
MEYDQYPIIHTVSEQSQPYTNRSIKRKKDIYTIDLDFEIFEVAWSNIGITSKLAVTSFRETYPNYLYVFAEDSSSSSENVYQKQGSIQVIYPPSKLLWMNREHYLATVSDAFRLYSQLEENQIVETCTLARVYPSDILTSFDWCVSREDAVVIASLKSSVAVWNLERKQQEIHWSAQDPCVFDVACTINDTGLATAGGDGIARLFDRRHGSISTILYESPDRSPLVRLRWNPHDEHLLAILTHNSSHVNLIDTRYPGLPVAELRGHLGPIQGCSWSPIIGKSNSIATVGRDSNIFIWDVSLSKMNKSQPILAYSAEESITHVSWNPIETEWIAIACRNVIHILRI